MSTWWALQTHITKLKLHPDALNLLNNLLQAINGLYRLAYTVLLMSHSVNIILEGLFDRSFWHSILFTVFFIFRPWIKYLSTQGTWWILKLHITWCGWLLKDLERMMALQIVSLDHPLYVLFLASDFGSCQHIWSHFIWILTIFWNH